VVELFVSKALICVLGQCFAALVGDSTPLGTFPLQHVVVEYDGRRDAVLAYAYDEAGGVYAIHRPPSARRRALLASNDTTPVTAGCINVEDPVLDYLIACCAGTAITIHE
jgi:hypothetical protein